MIFFIDNVRIRIHKNQEDFGVPYPKTRPIKVFSGPSIADDWAMQGRLPASFEPMQERLDERGKRRLRWVQKRYMIYNYCKDLKHFPEGLPRDCKP
ncbi:unnamed protein product [Thlaspi arvense]|uniref:Xyloglucan endo-transglycosylase C-terminal domain-containing protein n=1 Tax=Thlaspi arvense TaxID=13288 RepID=A0AAU9RHD9_THLAR|nr:unnamed protein product [Thlaspi arvense]